MYEGMEYITGGPKPSAGARMRGAVITQNYN